MSKLTAEQESYLKYFADTTLSECFDIAISDSEIITEDIEDDDNAIKERKLAAMKFIIKYISC